MDKGAEYYSRYLNGDDEGLVLLVRDYKDGLIMYLYGICKNIHTAEDLCEDTFVRLVTKKPKYTGKASFKTWLYTIGRNVAYSEMRKAHVHVSADELEIPDDMTLEERYETDERRAAVRRLAGYLKPAQREAVWLTYFEGMTVKETARIMKKNEGAVSLLLFRAKKELKKMLEREGITGEDI
ncbi:MAG: RNA polymerase sigma factor [Clostridia bacterium]|nr:RNA polymerase sigma factor [Clostridia bacterium]